MGLFMTSTSVGLRRPPSLPEGFAIVWKVLAFTALYVFLDWLSYIHASNAFGVTPWNPQPALAIAVLLYYGKRWLPAVFIAILLSEVLVRSATLSSFPILVLSTLALSLGFATTAQWLLGKQGPKLPIGTRGDLFRLFVGVAGGMLFTGAIYIGALVVSDVARLGDAPSAMLQFWIGDVVGIVVTLPLILTLADPRQRASLRRAVKDRVAFAQLATIVLVLWWALRGTPADHLKYLYMLFLPVVWVAMRHGIAGSSVAIGIIQVGVVLAVLDSGYPTAVVYDLQAIMIAITVTGLFLGAAVDERMRMSEELRETLRIAAAGRMAATLAHELNQPLTALVAYATSARHVASLPEPPPGQLGEVLDSVVAEAKRSAEVVRRMRDFFRIGAIELRPTRMIDLVRRSIDALRDQARARSIEVTLLASEAPEILADQLQIEVVMRNLLTNAFEALSSREMPRQVDIEVLVQGQALIVSVRDNGPGIPPEMLPRLFKPQASPRPSGMGMGLAICRAIVEAHGGRLWAEGGPGACFHLSLPIGHNPDE